MDTRTKVLLSAGTLGVSCGGIPWAINQASSQNPTNLTNSSTLVTVSTSEEPAPAQTLDSVEPTSQITEEPFEQTPVASAPEESPLPAPHPPVRVRSNSENCLVESRVDDLETLLSNSFALNGQVLIDANDFVRVTCSKTIPDKESKMPSDWEGLFPKELFEKMEEVVVGKKIEIKTQTSGDSTRYKTTFSGSHFEKEEIVGEWDKASLDLTEKKVTEVKITSSIPTAKKIYLMFKK